jgi:hypothetical protein
VNNGGNGATGVEEIIGGGIRGDGPLSLERVYVSGNLGTLGGGLSLGATATIRNSTFFNNHATFSGGALSLDFPPSPYTVSIQNSTLYLNQCSAATPAASAPATRAR